MIGKTLLSAVALSLAAMAAADTADASTFKVIHTFTGTGGDGANPVAGLIEDSAGNLYGTTEFGGANNEGTVFQLSPPIAAAAPWTETIIYDFGIPDFHGFFVDGTNPETALIIDSNGALYGTTSDGAVVFRLTPPAPGEAAWTNTVLYNFDNLETRGQFPIGLTLSSDGTLYVTTAMGGRYKEGRLFKLIPKINKDGQWTSSILHDFKSNTLVGATPRAPVIVDATGNLYGGDDGALFEYAPPAAGRIYGTTTAVFNLPGPHSFYGPTPDASGDLYIACFGCGAAGSILKLTPPKSGIVWSAVTIHPFVSGTRDGQYPEAVLSLDAQGNLYGTTSKGGVYNMGTIFKLMRPKSGDGLWKETLLHSSTDGSQGMSPGGGVIVDAAGNVFGTMTYGGNKPGLKGDGVVYEITP